MWSFRPASCLSPAIVTAFLIGPASASADDLTVIRASVKQRLSLLQTLDVELRAWTDTEFSRVPPDVQLVEGETRFHWMTDQGKVFYETGPAESPAERLYYDGRSTIQLFGDGMRASTAKRPPSSRLFGYATLPDLLGLMLTWNAGDLNTVLSASDARIDAIWNPSHGDCDVVVTCSLDDPVLTEAHLGFDAARGYAPSVLHWGSPDGQAAIFFAEEWMTVRSGITGEELWVPSRARYVALPGNSDSQFSSLAEVDRFELPSSIPKERFVASIPPGAQVWRESETPGRSGDWQIAGGSEGVAIRAERAAREIEDAMNQVRASGRTFSAKPQPTRSWWMFLVVGFALVGAGLGWRRLRSR